MFVLPNLFTVSSIFCGIYSLTLSSGEATGEQLYKAALAIFFGIFFDAFDGRVARLTKTQSEFGVELDSLADVVSFGVAPALLVYKWALAPLGTLGIFAACAYASCGAMRLARFNVLAHRSGGHSSPYFVGLPIPLAAGTLVSLVIAYHGVGASSEDLGSQPVLAVVLVLSYLMISNIHYRTFKDARLSRKSALIFILVCVSGLVVSYQSRPSSVLIAYFTAYIVMGLAEEIVLFRKRRAEEAAAAESEPEEPVMPAEEDEEAEETDDAEGENFV